MSTVSETSSIGSSFRSYGFNEMSEPGRGETGVLEEAVQGDSSKSEQIKAKELLARSEAEKFEKRMIERNRARTDEAKHLLALIKPPLRSGEPEGEAKHLLALIKLLLRFNDLEHESERLLALIKLLLTSKPSEPNLSEARKIADQMPWGDGRVRAMIEISRYQTDDQARVTLAEIKNSVEGGVELSSCLQVYQEEMQRQLLPEAKETREKLLKLISSKEGGKGIYYWFLVLFKAKNSSSIEDLLDLFEAQVALGLPKAATSLKEAKKKALLEKHPILFVSYWASIIAVEAQFPDYHSIMMEDVNFILKTIEKKEEGLQRFSSEIHTIFEAILPVNVNKAKEILKKQSNRYFAFSDQIKLFVRQVNTEGFDRKAAFSALANQAREMVGYPGDKAHAYIELFELAARVFGVKEAASYLDLAKETIPAIQPRGFPDMAPCFCVRDDRVYAWARIIKAEMVFGLPSLEESLSRFYRLAEGASFGLHGSTIKIIVKVECERLKKQLERQEQGQRQAS